jgi:hypothetical protein
MRNNDKCRMTRNAGEGAAGLSNDEGSPNAQMTKARAVSPSVIRISSLFRHSEFVIRH